MKAGDDGLFDTPEEAALSSWATTPSAFAKVVDVRREGDQAEVVIETRASNLEYNREYCYCFRTPEGRWWYGHSNG